MIRQTHFFVQQSTAHWRKATRKRTMPKHIHKRTAMQLLIIELSNRDRARQRRLRHFRESAPHHFRLRRASIGPSSRNERLTRPGRRTIRRGRARTYRNANQPRVRFPARLLCSRSIARARRSRNRSTRPRARPRPARASRSGRRRVIVLRHASSRRESGAARTRAVFDRSKISVATNKMEKKRDELNSRDRIANRQVESCIR